MNLTSTKTIALVGAAAATLGGATAAASDAASTSHPRASFALVRSAGSVKAGCLVNAGAQVQIRNQGPVEVMTIDAHGLPKSTDFDVFATQLPNAPFGISWYQGDLQSNGRGNAHGTFVGRFSMETFAVALGRAPRRSCTTSRSPMPARTQPSRRCTSTTSASGSIRPPMPATPAVRTA
jgi:hypothetical protein